VSGHPCHFVFRGAPCARPTAHSFYRATVIDGKEVEKQMHWMCEEHYAAFVQYAREVGNDWSL